MALTNYVSRKQYYLLMFIGSRLLQTYAPNRQQSSHLIERLDGIDDFTSQLMQTKSIKWEVRELRKKLFKNVGTYSKRQTNFVQYNVELRKLNAEELDTMLRDAIDVCNIPFLTYIINKCIDHHVLPSSTVLLQILSVHSTAGDLDGISQIIKLCEMYDESTLKSNSGFLHYLAEATWVKGNITKSITMFEDVFRNNVGLRHQIQTMINNLIWWVVPNSSEANLILLVRFAERIANDFKEQSFLMQLWRFCFLSEWHSDQTLAFDMLKRHTDLFTMRNSNKLTRLAALSLRNNQTENVYRLLEVLLFLKRKSCYANILEVLFDYRVYNHDLRGCTEIMHWALDHNIDLPALQQEKFVGLLLSKTDILNVQSKAPKCIVDTNRLSYKF